MHASSWCSLCTEQLSMPAIPNESCSRLTRWHLQNLQLCRIPNSNPSTQTLYRPHVTLRVVTEERRAAWPPTHLCTTIENASALYAASP